VGPCLARQLYTTDGQDAFEWFSKAPELFRVYHQGFTTQVTRWPVNPVE
jgi:ribosomal RNA-processing protein 8